MISHLFCVVLGAGLLYAGQKFHFHRQWKALVANYKAGGTSSDDDDLTAKQDAEPWNDNHFGGTRG